MKKSERKLLEKQIAESVNVLLQKYEAKPTKKLQKIVNEAAKDISKKVYKTTKDTEITAKTSLVSKKAPSTKRKYSAAK